MEEELAFPKVLTNFENTFRDNLKNQELYFKHKDILDYSLLILLLSFFK